MTRPDGYDRMAHLYDLFSSKETIEFHVSNASGLDEILDIGAGTGRVAVPIAEKGTRVICVEPSAAMVRQLRKKLDQRPDLKRMITIVEGTATSFSLGRTVQAALMSGVFDHFLIYDERAQALKNIADHLESGGRLAFEVWLGLMTDSPATWAGEATLGDTTYRRTVGRKVLPDGTVDLEIVITVHRGGQTVDRIEQHSTAAVSDRQLVHRLLAETGFRIEHEFGGYDRSPYHEGDSVLIIEATKL